MSVASTPKDCKHFGHREFDQEVQLPFKSVEKDACNNDRGLLARMRERPLLVGIAVTLVLLAVLGGVLGAVLGGGGSSNSGPLLEDETADSRLVAVLREGEGCPSKEQTNASTHIVLPPVTVYTTDAQGARVCSADCTIEFATSPCEVAKWREQGKKVMLSFGGSGWDGCWSSCYGREQHVSKQLSSLRLSLGMDGVAFLFEHSPGDAAELTAVKTFYVNVTQQLRSEFPAYALIGHIGRDTDLVKGTWYHSIMEVVGHSIDFLVAQYFDGVTRPGLDGIRGGVHSSALQHFGTLVEESFGGDSTKLVFGFCISGCSTADSNTDAVAAAAVMKELQVAYPCNGGAAYWVGEDEGGVWGREVGRQVQHIKGCSVDGIPSSYTLQTFAPHTAPPTAAPTLEPTDAPVPTLPPTPVPTEPKPGCHFNIPLQRECLYNPHCCTPGTRCYKQSSFKANCLAVCNYPPRCQLLK